MSLFTDREAREWMERANKAEAEIERLRAAAKELHQLAAIYSGFAVPLRGEEDQFFAAESRFAAAMDRVSEALGDDR